MRVTCVYMYKTFHIRYVVTRIISPGYAIIMDTDRGGSPGSPGKADTGHGAISHALRYAVPPMCAVTFFGACPIRFLHTYTMHTTGRLLMVDGLLIIDIRLCLT